MDLARAVYHRDLKIAVMREVDAGGSAGEIARKYQLSPNLLWRWGAELGRHGEPTPALDEARRIAELERKIGQLTVENDFLKKALQHFRAHHPPAVVSGAAVCTKKSAKPRKTGKP